ncbi:hypothetical protein BKA61DRAFT_620523 [Leptodontidium sp. MPI-SDFR-AT-0119]|nr:hypothetical protein BKA61DRAFT_620523 [Leptodontidium sp. MPI-SDFR-AT-0119]
MPPIKNKQDLLQYLDYFNKVDYDNFPGYFSHDAAVDINGVIKTTGRQSFVDFIRAQREHMLENLTVDACYFAKGAITTQSTVIFTPLRDINEAQAGLPPVKLGQQIQQKFLIIYLLDDSDRIRGLHAAFAAPATIIEKGGEDETKLTRSRL